MQKFNSKRYKDISKIFPKMVFGIFRKKQKNQSGKYTRMYYSFRSVLSGKVLDVAQDGPFKGSTILWEGYAGDNQCFTLVQ